MLFDFVESIYNFIVNKCWSEEKHVYINGMSCSFPVQIYNENQMKEMFIENYCGGKTKIRDEDFDFINRVFKAALIDKCHVNLNKEDLFRQMKREEYTNYVKSTLLSLSIESALNAIKDSQIFEMKDVTHLIFGTMTGTIAAPSMDIYIAKQLNLNATVKRLNVESMGCLTGFRLVGLSRDIAAQNPSNVVLLIVSDIRSALGNQLTKFISNEPIDKSNVIICALFRDSSCAAVFSQRKASKPIQVIDHQSFLIENTIHLGRLKEFNDGSIHLYLDKQLPYAVFDALPSFLNPILVRHQVDLRQCQFAVHTGGPKILRGIRDCLKLQDEQLCASWFVMKSYGNLSGSSNLVVVEHLRKWKYSNTRPFQSQIDYPKDFSIYKYLIGLSFGPGIAVECVLFKLD